MKQFVLKDWKEGNYLIPKELKGKKGIYFIKLPKAKEKIAINFNSCIPCHEKEEKSKPYKKVDLEEKINKTIINGERILYIGKAGGKNQKSDLYTRLNQYMKYLFRKGKIHRGGRAIAQINGFENLICEYEVLDDVEPEDKEKCLLCKFKEKYGEYPLANWRL